jgi:hypothetical protein
VCRCIPSVHCRFTVSASLAYSPSIHSEHCLFSPFTVYALSIRCLFSVECSEYTVNTQRTISFYSLPILFAVFHALCMRMLFTVSSLSVACALPGIHVYSLSIHMELIHCLFISRLLTVYALSIHCPFAVYSLSMYCLFNVYSMSHCLFTVYSLSIHCACTVYVCLFNVYSGSCTCG